MDLYITGGNFKRTRLTINYCEGLFWISDNEKSPTTIL